VKQSPPEIPRATVHGLSSKAPIKSRRELPFEKHDPDAKPDKAFRFETNAYDRALFKYVAVLRGEGESVTDVIRKFARDRAQRELGKAAKPGAAAEQVSDDP
jgi:hypothetical protein